MLDIKKTYDLYCSKIKTNKTVMNSVNLMLNCGSTLQYTILQIIGHNKGVTKNLFIKSGMDEELIDILLPEIVKNNLAELKGDKYYITENGKNVLISTYYTGLESLG